MPQIFNPILPELMVTGVVTQISKDAAFPPPNSLSINLQVGNTLTGQVMCMVMAYPLSRPPNSDEILGTYFDNPTVINALDFAIGWWLDYPKDPFLAVSSYYQRRTSE